MRDYVRKRGIVVRPEQLELIVPAFELAWKAVERRGGFLLAGSDLDAFRDRVAKTVVEVVTNGDWADPTDVAEAAVATLLPDNRSPPAA